MKMLRPAGLVLLMTVLFTSCLENKDPQFDIVGDVFVVKKRVDNEVKYAPTYFVYGNLGIKSAKVTLPDAGGTVTLEGTTGSLTYFKEPAEADFSANTPDEGNYLFEAISSKDETLQIGDELEIEDLIIPDFDILEFESSTKLHVSWNEITGADGFFLRILDDEGNYVYISNSIDKNTFEYNIMDDDSQNWKQSVSSGETYTIQINAVVYDAEATAISSAYNIQMIATSQAQITWE